MQRRSFCRRRKSCFSRIGLAAPTSSFSFSSSDDDQKKKKEPKNDDDNNRNEFDDDEKSNINIKTVLRFDVVAKLKPGETLKIVGSIPELGNWDCENGLALVWSENHRWKGSIEIERLIFVGHHHENGGDTFEEEEEKEKDFRAPRVAAMDEPVTMKCVIEKKKRNNEGDDNEEGDDDNNNYVWEEGKNRGVELFSYDVACINGELRYPDATVTGAFGHPGETTVVFDDEMYAKKIMKENESEEGRREAMDVAERSRECLIEWEEKQEKGEEGSLTSSSGSSSSSSGSSSSGSSDGEDVAKARHDEEAEEADDAQEVSEMIKEEEKAARIRRKRIIDESKFTPSVVRVAKVDTMNSKWHLKLESVKGIVGFNVPELDDEKLATAATYLRWVSAGTIECTHPEGAIPRNETENAEEYNEKRRAAIEARSIFASVEKVEGETYQFGQKLTTSEASLVRHINPWLPSFDARFAPMAPLTKIRDLCNAIENDDEHKDAVPEWLQTEVKHSIEGNLLKNFDADALTATRRILDKVRRLNNTDENEEASINESFVDDLNAFYVELKSFLGGGQVFERLDDVRDRLDDESDVMQSVATLYSAHFAAQSARITSSFNTSGSGGRNNNNNYDDDDDVKNINVNRGWFSEEGEQTLNALRAATRVRAHFCSGLVTGLRNDAPDEAINERHRWRQCETALEQYAFLRLAAIEKMARTSNVYEEVLSSSGSNVDAQWQRMSEILAIGLRHVGMSGYERRECETVAAELETWCNVKSRGSSKNSPPTESIESLRRLRASLNRARRIVDSKLNSIVEGFALAPEILGYALGLPENVGEDHVEFAIREDVSFEILLLLNACEKAINAAIHKAASSLSSANENTKTFKIVSSTAMDTTRTDVCRVVVIDGALNEEALQRATTTKSGSRKKKGTVQSENDNLFVVVRRNSNDDAAYRDETEFEFGEAYANRVKCVAFISASSSSSSASEKKKRKKKKSALSSKEPQMSNATIAAGKAYDETDILYVDKLLMKAMKTSARNHASIKYPIVSTDDTKEIVNLMSMAKVGQRAMVSISPALGVQISAHDEDDITFAKTPTDHERLDANTIKWETGDGCFLALDDATRQTCGETAHTFRVLENVGIVVPFGMCDIFNRQTSLAERIEQIESYGEGLLSNAENERLAEHACDDIQEIINNNPLSEKFIENALKGINSDTSNDIIAVSVSGSSNNDVDDATLDLMETHCEANNSQAVSKAISDIWASIWTIEAVKRRAMHKIKQSEASIAVVVRRANHFEKSFAVSIGDDGNEIREIRLRVGLRACPRFDECEWTMSAIENSDDAFETVTFANISEASRSRKTAPWFGKITSERVTYSQEPLSVSKDERVKACENVLKVCRDFLKDNKNNKNDDDKNGENAASIEELRGGFEGGKCIISSVKFRRR